MRETAELVGKGKGSFPSGAGNSLFGKAHTVALVRLKSGEIAGGYMAPAWQKGNVDDPSGESFVCALRNDKLPKVPARFKLVSPGSAGFGHANYVIFGPYNGAPREMQWYVNGTYCHSEGVGRYEAVLGGRGVLLGYGGNSWVPVEEWEVWKVK
jgi:hypothetical protein